MRDKYSITKKREKKVEEMKRKADLKYTILLQNEKRKWEQNYEYFVIKIEKKKNSFIKKKEDEYRRKMLNEIRELE
jgi:trehalose/maltose hydrolase-like predicted phosphorylase